MPELKARLNLGSINFRRAEVDGEAVMVDTATNQQFPYDFEGEGVVRIRRVVDDALTVLGNPQIAIIAPWGEEFYTTDLGCKDAALLAQNLANMRSLNLQYIWEVFLDRRKVEPTA
jgi:hypothetical protein